MMGRPKDKNSIRQRILNLKVGASAVFPAARVEYITSVMYRVGKTSGHKYTRLTTGKQIKVTRME